MRADDELGLVSVGLEELSVDARIEAREIAVFALGVLDDCDVCQKAVSIAQILRACYLLEHIWKGVVSERTRRKEDAGY
jgi:hypothetical protein